MNAVRFPDMFDANKTALVSDLEATEQNLRTLLLSSKMTLFGHPNFGTNMQRLIFEPNNVVIRDIVIDDIYTAIKTFMWQITILRKNITIVQDRNNISVRVVATNNLDANLHEYTIDLLNVEEM